MNDPRRTALLAIAILLTGVGGTVIALGNELPVWTIMMRAGIALGVIWLAMPELSRWTFARSWQFVSAMLLIGVVLVTRPKMALFAVAAVALAMLANFLLGRVARALMNKSRRQ